MITRSTLIALMGQFSVYTGQKVAWEELSASRFCHAPKPENVREGAEPPVKPGPDGTYPVFIPGQTKLREPRVEKPGQD